MTSQPPVATEAELADGWAAPFETLEGAITYATDLPNRWPHTRYRIALRRIGSTYGYRRWLATPTSIARQESTP